MFNIPIWATEDDTCLLRHDLAELNAGVIKVLLLSVVLRLDLIVTSKVESWNVTTQD